MDCNLTNDLREQGFRCRSFDCKFCVEYFNTSGKLDVIKSLEERVKNMEMVIRKINDDYWFMINLIERYSTDKDQALKDVLERMKFRKPLMEKALK